MGPILFLPSLFIEWQDKHFLKTFAPCATSPKAKRLDKSTEDSVEETKDPSGISTLYATTLLFFTLNIMSEILPIPKTINIVTKIAATILFISKEFILIIIKWSYNMLIRKILNFFNCIICVSWTHKLMSQTMLKTLILIPSRLSATRLPGKPLLKINGLSIISHVVKKAQESKIGETYVATEDKEIVEDVEKNGGKAILTSKNHKTGSDRIFECFQKLNLKDVDYIINLQGDEPDIDIDDLKHLDRLVKKNSSEIGTLASKIKDKSIIINKNIVKVITETQLGSQNFPLALKFQRKIDQSENRDVSHHIGIYAYKTEILEKIVKLGQSKNEIKNNLEQLRAIDNGIKINVALAKSSSIGVDTMEDYLELKKILEYKS